MLSVIFCSWCDKNKVYFILYLFLRVQLTTSQHWSRLCLVAEQATSLYLNQCWLSSPMHMRRWVNSGTQGYCHCYRRVHRLISYLAMSCKYICLSVISTDVQKYLSDTFSLGWVFFVWFCYNLNRECFFGWVLRPSARREWNEPIERNEVTGQSVFRKNVHDCSI